MECRERRLVERGRGLSVFKLSFVMDNIGEVFMAFNEIICRSDLTFVNGMSKSLSLFMMELCIGP